MSAHPAVINFAPDPGSVELREFSAPEIGDDDILLEVAAVGVCGSDLHQWTADHSWPVNYPVVLGHEFGGRIARLGKNVSGWAEGDRVVSETAAIIDPNNPMSKRGLYNLDPTRKGFGYGVNGAMTREVRYPARCLHSVPDALELEIACLTEPCSVAWNAVSVNSRIQPGDRVLVIGPGTIGILCAAVAKLHGAEVALLGLPADAVRLEVARQYGCETLDNNEAAEAWCQARDGMGADLIIDAAGVSPTLRLAVDLVRPAGWITKVGWGRAPLDFSLDPLVQKNVTLQGSFSHNWPIWERVIALLTSGELDVRPIIGGQWSLEDWHEAFEKMHSRPSREIRPHPMRTPPYFLIIFLLCASAPLRETFAEPKEIPLWPENPPGEFGEPGPDESKQSDREPNCLLLTKVTKPTLTLYPAPEEKANGTAILVAPGGGYHVLAWDKEGTEVAEWLNTLGITAAVLKYRVPRRDPEKPHAAPLQDAQRALRLMRHKAVEWRINPTRIGMLGFSAGGHLTVMSGLLWDEDSYPKIDDADHLSAKPDFLIPIYPGGMLDKKSTQVFRLTEDIAINEFTPPAFIVHAYDDHVSAAQSALFFLELKKFKIPAELHIYDRGGHGYGLRENPQHPVTTWPARLEDWLRVNEFLDKK